MTEETVPIRQTTSDQRKYENETDSCAMVTLIVPNDDDDNIFGHGQLRFHDSMDEAARR